MQVSVLSAFLIVLSSFTAAQGHPLTVAPGLTITSGTLPWALDRYEDKPQLVPIHHSTVELNSHKAANLAGSLAGSFFYKPKLTTELTGPHARTRIHSTTPVIYIFRDQEPDTSGDSENSLIAGWAISGALPVKDHRVFAKIQFTQLTGNAKRNDGLVDAKWEPLGDGWFRLTPSRPLEPGEYAITPVFKNQSVFSSVIYDFGVDPAAPNAADVIPAE